VSSIRRILGIRYGHDAAAALVVDGVVVADAAEERFSRVKNDTSFPLGAIAYCLRQAGCSADELDAVVFPSRNFVPPPFFAFFQAPSRVSAPDGGPILPIYFRKWNLAEHCQVLTIPHHLAHAAAAHYTAGIANEPTLIVTADGIGDDISITLWKGLGTRIEKLREWDGSASLGWFYASATEALGWRHGSDEWKTMGLAPYGRPQPGVLNGFHPEFEDGELRRPHDYGQAGRWLDHGANHYHMRDATPLSMKVAEMGRENFAAEVQRIAEVQALNLILPAIRRTGLRTLCCAGGFFLNVKLNQRIWYSGEVEGQWIYPNPGDSGLPVGAALYAYYSAHPQQPCERLRHLYLGPGFNDQEIEAVLRERKLSYEKHADIAATTARLLAANKIVAWFQGRMESGPRALGSRSILMSPLRAENKDVINACVKYREAFRPFCPSLLYEAMNDYLVRPRDEPFMITSFDVRPEMRNAIPAVVHVDGTARPQTVRRDVNPLYYDLIREFGAMSGHPVILNTSFNVKGEPIVCNPREALKCFIDTGLDALVMGRYLIQKSVGV
jgi:carbamoyltransferase